MKLIVIVIVVVVLGLGGWDGQHVLAARTNARNTAGAAANAAAHSIFLTHDEVKARAAADQVAKDGSAVVTKFNYDPHAAKVDVTVSGSADTLVLHYLDRGLVQDIAASASARPS